MWEALAVPGGVASSCKVKDGELDDVPLCCIIEMHCLSVHIPIGGSEFPAQLPPVHYPNSGSFVSLYVSPSGALTINDQVQGGAPSYRHNLLLLEKFGFKPTPVMMRIAFGTGNDQWTNHSPSALTSSLEKEIERFGRVLKWISFFEPIFVFLPIDRVGVAGVV